MQRRLPEQTGDLSPLKVAAGGLMEETSWIAGRRLIEESDHRAKESDGERGENVRETKGEEARSKS